MSKIKYGTVEIPEVDPKQTRITVSARSLNSLKAKIRLLEKDVDAFAALNSDLLDRVSVLETALRTIADGEAGDDAYFIAREALGEKK